MLSSTTFSPRSTSKHSTSVKRGCAQVRGETGGGQHVIQNGINALERGRATKLLVTDVMASKAAAEMEKILDWMELVHGGHRALTGTRVLATLSKSQYSMHYKSLRDFLITGNRS
jgi:hypothetical protein